MTGTATLTRPADPAVDVDDPDHLSCRVHQPDRAFCGADVTGEPWVPWTGDEPVCALCLYAVERSGRTPCDGCLTDWLDSVRRERRST